LVRAAIGRLGLRRAILIKSAGKPLRVASWKTASVRAFLKLLITKTLYHSLIQRSIALYQTMIHLFALEEKQAEAFRQSRREPDGHRHRRLYKLCDDGMVPLICPTCQNVFRG
jgi:hypothetical protein